MWRVALSLRTNPERVSFLFLTNGLKGPLLDSLNQCDGGRSETVGTMVGISRSSLVRPHETSVVFGGVFGPPFFSAGTGHDECGHRRFCGVGFGLRTRGPDETVWRG